MNQNLIYFDWQKRANLQEFRTWHFDFSPGVLPCRSKFWARMGIDIVLIESEPKKRMYLSVRALGVAAITAGAVGIAVGMVLGAFAIKPLLKQNKQRARKKAKPKSKTTKGATKAGPASKPVTDHTKPSPSSIPNVEQPASSTGRPLSCHTF